jgi:hypothetical protein
MIETMADLYELFNEIYSFKNKKSQILLRNVLDNIWPSDILWLPMKDIQ